MAIGFGATSGSGSTDVLSYAGVADQDVLSCAFWVWRNVEQNQQFVGVDDGSSAGWFIQNTSGTTHRIITRFDTTIGLYTFAASTLSSWYHVAFTHDRSNAANLPTVYVDGFAVSVSEAQAAVGTYQTGTDPMRIGNRGAGDRVVDGIIAEVGLWNRILTADEVAAMALVTNLGGGQFQRPALTPAAFPVGRTFYAPLIRGTQNLDGAAATVTGTAVQPHPRVMYPLDGYTVTKGSSSPEPPEVTVTSATASSVTASAEIAYVASDVVFGTAGDLAASGSITYRGQAVIGSASSMPASLSYELEGAAVFTSASAFPTLPAQILPGAPFEGVSLLLASAEIRYRGAARVNGVSEMVASPAIAIPAAATVSSAASMTATGSIARAMAGQAQGASTVLATALHTGPMFRLYLLRDGVEPVFWRAYDPADRSLALSGLDLPDGDFTLALTRVDQYGSESDPLDALIAISAAGGVAVPRLARAERLQAVAVAGGDILLTWLVKSQNGETLPPRWQIALASDPDSILLSRAGVRGGLVSATVGPYADGQTVELAVRAAREDGSSLPGAPWQNFPAVVADAAGPPPELVEVLDVP